MKTKIAVACTLLAVLLISGACTGAVAQGTNGTNQSAEVTVKSADEFTQNQHMQKQVEVAQGDTLVVTLPSNATTGFSWDENALIADAGILQQTKHESVTADSSKLGAPGAEQWTFKTLKAGATTIHLEYSRPWAGGEKGLWTLDLAITVK